MKNSVNFEYNAIIYDLNDVANAGNSLHLKLNINLTHTISSKFNFAFVSMLQDSYHYYWAK